MQVIQPYLLTAYATQGKKDLVRFDKGGFA